MGGLGRPGTFPQAFHRLSTDPVPGSTVVPIRPDLRPLYPADWPQISRWVRFVRAGGRCEHCGRPHGRVVWQLADGRWLDPARGDWRDGQGREASWPDLVELASAGTRCRVVLAAAHLDHDPRHNAPTNLAALCQRCHLAHDRRVHRWYGRWRRRARRALADLFLPALPPVGDRR